MATPFGLTEDGHELQIGSNHFGHFLLFRLLEPLLSASGTDALPSRVIALSSAGHRFGEIRFDGNATRYDRKLTRHDHALCNNCGKLVDLELSIPAALIGEASALSKFDAQSIELTLRGLSP